MSSRIALITRLSKAAEDNWLTVLSAAMPRETIRSIRAMSTEELALVDIAIVANPDPVDLERLPNVKWVHSLWAGVERLVLELKGFSHPIVRLVDPDLARTMAEAVLAWTLYLSRDMPAYGMQQRQSLWRQLPYRSALDTRVGLLGLGALGCAAARQLQLAGFAVSGWSRTEKQVEGVATYFGPDGLDAMLKTSDIVVCLLPLTAETTGLLGAREFALLPPNACFINFGRGHIVRTNDLMAALDTGAVSHAVLDVFETEPLDEQSPLWGHSRVTVLPHISAPTNQSTAANIVANRVGTYRTNGVLPEGIDFNRGY
ncbi:MULTISPECIES: 2-hydroxyacid dehydrogenase [unclassified Rhizobium]|uniref:2-hydroxyacid dehydrogenase n=1 Tax=unclassified Rhizobium TaxID=2613769 RepID=UPI001ADB8A9D|nr:MULTISPECIES: glyoxylate/hydroxypyruvate reductase A [unclassified Rhizobium]MBO9127300.1 glyoxylate/hydroxypyruvate reductase A [Rhizobium sp. 16-488-2b]MBO9177743.1 glyoxylate/hydroxypyruvate reductase A [Rhizobium sp. 16-488-2a]